MHFLAITKQIDLLPLSSIIEDNCEETVNGEVIQSVLVYGYFSFKVKMFSVLHCPRK